MKKQRLLFFALFLGCFIPALAQGVRFDIPPILTAAGKPVANPIISLCPGTATVSGAACSPATGQSTTDITNGSLCPIGSPVTLTGLNTCQATGDNLGNAGFWLKPGAYIYCITGSGITGACYNLTVPVGATSAGVANIGTFTAPSMNGTIALDGTKYALTVAGLQSALSDCNASTTCSGVDARQLGSVSSTTTTTVPAYRTLWIGPNTVITGTSDPVMCYNNGSAIIGDYTGEGSLGTVGTIKTTVAASRVLAPCTPNPRTTTVYFMGLDLWNSNGAATAAVLDMTGVSHGRLDNNFIQHSGGTGDLILIAVASGNDAFYNLFVGEKIFGGGGGAGYHITGTANSQVIVGGKIDNTNDCLLIDSTASQVNEISVFGTACESQVASVIHTIANTSGVRWFGGRWESPSPATLFNISASSSQIEAIGVGEYNTQTCGTTNSLVTIIGWPTGSPCITSGIDIFTPTNISAQAYIGQNSGVTSTFTNNANANDVVTFTTNGVSNGNGVLFADSHAGGHNFRFGEFNVNGEFDIRDTVQTGQPAWGFQMLGTTSARAVLSNTITATRTYTFPDLSSGIPVVFSCGSTGSGSQTCAPAAATVKTQIYNGESTLAANAATITFPNGFTSATSYFCVANDVTTRANPVQMIPVSATTATITNTTGATDVIQWLCIGQ